MSYLILSTDVTPQDMIKPAEDDPYLAWKLLVDRYQPVTVDAYGRLMDDMSSCELDDSYDNLEVWINKVMRINVRLIAIKPSYGLDDVQIVAKVLNKLTKDLYEMFITNVELNGYAKTTLYEFQTKLTQFWSKHVQNRSSHLIMTLKQDQPKEI